MELELPVKQFGEYIEFCDSLIKIDAIKAVCLVRATDMEHLPDHLCPKYVRIILDNGTIITSHCFYNGSIESTKKMSTIVTDIIKERQNREY